jgi:hypothetical protein
MPLTIGQRYSICSAGLTNLSSNFARLGQQFTVVNIIPQVLDQFSIRVVGHYYLRSPIECTDETGKSSPSTEFEDSLSLDKLICMFLEVSRYHPSCVP